MDSPVDAHAKSKRHSKSCQRCQRRKQRCHGFPICSNCQTAKKICIQSDFAIELHRSSSEYAAFERIRQLEEKLAAALARGATESRNARARERDEDVGGQSLKSQRLNSEGSGARVQNQPDLVDGATVLPAPEVPQDPNLTTSQDQGARRIADTVGFLSLGDSVSREPAYVGSSSGISLAMNLGNLVQSTIWRKALASTISESQSKPLSVTELTDNQCGPPNDEIGSRIVKAYFTKVHHRYPFMDRGDMLRLHANRHQTTGSSPREQYGTFKLYMIYAIGSTLLQLTESYNDTSPEKYFITAMQYISAARESHSIYNLEAMILLVLYNLRSPSNSGLWYFIGLAVRTSIDLGLHREAHYTNLTPYQSQLRRRLFWSVYLLDRVVAISLGRPVNIADQDIDVSLPLDVDDTVSDNNFIAQLLARPLQPNRMRQTTNLTMWTELVKLKRIESQIQCQIYRVDKPTSSLFPKVAPLLLRLEQWKGSVPSLTVAEDNYLALLWNKAVRLLIQPFLNMLSPQDDLLKRCLISSGQVCQIFKRMFQQDSYGHSFISVHSIFIAGITICYCLCLNPSLWGMATSNDLRACSSALFVMAERTPSVRRYRDVLETVISSAMDYVMKASAPTERPEPHGVITSHEHQAVQSLLGLSSAPSELTYDGQLPQFAAPPSTFESAVTGEQAQTQPATCLRDDISNWTIEEPIFDFQWQYNDTFTGEVSDNINMDGWEEMGDCPFPAGGGKENVWAGDRFGLHMINKLLAIDSASTSEN